MTFKEFFKSKYFVIQLVLAVFVAIFILWLSLKFLDIYTHHGRMLTVPDLEGLYKKDVEVLLGDLKLNYAIHDSIYDSSRERGTVAAQEPSAGNEVKRRRTIYLTMVAELPEMVAMPELTDLSLRQAIAILHNNGLKVGELEYVPSIAQNAVLGMKYRQGTIEPGSMIEKGTKIDLVLGRGASAARVPVPFVVGKSRHEALMEINKSALNLGEEVYLDNERVNVKVYRQEPGSIDKTAYVNMGSSVNLFYRSVKVFDFDAYLKELMMVDIPILYGKSPEQVRDILEKSSLITGNEIFEKDVDEQNARVYKQNPDFFEENSVQRGAKINIWYRAIQDFDD